MEGNNEVGGTNSVPSTPQAPVSPAATSVNLPALGQGNNKNLFIVIGALVVVLLVVVLSWFFFFSPSAQSKRISNSFMSNLTKGNIEKANEIADGDSSYKSFLENAAKSVNGSFKLDESKFTDGKGYYVYSLSGADRKYARTVVEKVDGKRIVNSFVSSNSSLSLVPRSSSDEEDEPEDTDVSTPSKPSSSTNALACLSPSDYSAFSGGNDTSDSSYDSTYSASGDTINASNSVFFMPDSTEDDGWQDTAYEYSGEFAKDNANKTWKLRLVGSTYGSDSAVSSAARKLANERAQKVEDKLIAAGVPSNRIVIDTPRAYDKDPQDPEYEEIYRSVAIVVDPTCSSATTNSSSSSRGR